MRAKTNVVSVTLPIFKRIPDRGRLSWRPCPPASFPECPDTWQAWPELFEPFKIDRCLNIKAISAHHNSQRRTSGRAGIIDSSQPCRRVQIWVCIGPPERSCSSDDCRLDP